jgi:AcrR family transcriptional regulator
MIERNDSVNNDKQIRLPKQARSINLKEKILETALQLFYEKGYYKTTTNEIAKTAGISIGSLYSYFKDKDTIFLEILGRYHQQFVALHNESIKPDTSSTDKKKWLYNLIENLIVIHNTSKALNKELKALYYDSPQVTAIMDKQHEETLQIMRSYFKFWGVDRQIDDLEAAVIVSFDFISAIVDRIVFARNTIDKERLIRTTVEALSKFLIEES